MSAAKTSATLSPSLFAELERCRRGQRHTWNSTHSVLCGLLLERGLVREVKHRNGTRSYVPTRDGKRALRRES